MHAFTNTDPRQNMFTQRSKDGEEVWAARRRAVVRFCPPRCRVLAVCAPVVLVARPASLVIGHQNVTDHIRTTARHHSASALGRLRRNCGHEPCNLLGSTQLGLRQQSSCSVFAATATAVSRRATRSGVSGLSPYVAAVAARCLGMPSTRCSASHRATDYTAATARPPALRHEHTSPSPPPSLRSLSRSVWMHLGRASQTRATPAGLVLGHDHIRCTITRPRPSPPSSRRPRQSRPSPP